MEEQSDLVGRLRQYTSYLDEMIENEDRRGDEARRTNQPIIAGESSHIAHTYRSVQQELYRLFPEIKPGD